MFIDNFKPQKFEKATIYTTGNVLYRNIVRIDVREVTLCVAPYAQYQQSVYMNYIRKRDRNTRSLIAPRGYVVVVPTVHAVDPDDLFLPANDGVSSTRYDICDPTWRSDFDEKLSRANVPILADYRGLVSK